MSQKTQFLFNSVEDYKNFQKILNNYAKNESLDEKQRHRAIINTNQKLLCLPMKDIRRIAKDITKSDPEGFLKYCTYDSYEETLIAGIVIVQHGSLESQINGLENWRKHIDCWAHVDTVCSSMKMLKGSDEKGNYFEYFLNLCFDSEEFSARLGIVSLMVNYLQAEYIDKILNMCKTVKHNGYYVKMAVAWLLSYAFIDFREKTLNLLREKTLDKFTQNKAISKCRESFRVSAEDKQMLLCYKI